MSDQAPPTIPPRPVKPQAAVQGVSSIPLVPPRPISKRFERESSPSNFPRSPLDEPYSLTKIKSSDPTPARAPSISHMPLTGEEGMEYQSIQYQPTVPASSLAQDAAAQKRTIAEDLHLHAPKPSLSARSATAQVQSVTRTDSAHAAAHGIDRGSHDDVIPSRTRSRASFSRPDSAASAERRRSIWGDQSQEAEHGLRVPINPLLGDVQAPTPSMSPQVTGQLAHNHSRRKSGLDSFRPPDSYGLHGHGIVPQNKLEREWYERHPEVLEHEEGQAHAVYESIGAGRGAFAMSSDELNKLVRDTPSRGAGFGTNENINSYPDEQIGYIASEEYSKSRGTTPQPESLSRVQTYDNRPAAQSPLRKESFSASEIAAPGDAKAASMGHGQSSSNENAIYIDEPERKYNKVTGGQGSLDETQEVKPYASHMEEDGHEYRVPILAEDEVAKDAGSEYLHPAVSPKFERRLSVQHDDHADSGAHTPTSRPTSRPGSIYQTHSASHSLSRFISHPNDSRDLHTPLEDVAEYEPLFDDEDESKRKPLTTAERFKQRPGGFAHRFPSQDVWESAPESTYHETSVSTPDLPAQTSQSNTTAGTSETKAAFETPEQEHTRKGEVSETERKQLKPQEERLLGSRWLPHLRDDMPGAARPMTHRFPSSDVWESAPESSEHTTVIYPKDEEETSPVVQSEPTRDLGVDAPASSNQDDPSVPPQIPARPQKKTTNAVSSAETELTDSSVLNKQTSRELQGVPSLPDRPKPQIPPRPAKKASGDELSRTNTGGSTESSTAEREVKQKPQVPARPAAVGAAFANLKGNFMSDLNKKLGLGPPKEKAPESDVDAKPLEDSRKSRARGPQRRAPARSPAAEAASTSTPTFSISSAYSMWQIDEDDRLSTIHEAETVVSSHDTVDHTDHAEHQAPILKSGHPGDAPIPPPGRYSNVNPPMDAQPVPSGAAGQETKAVEEPIRTYDEQVNAPSVRQPIHSALSESTIVSAPQDTGTSQKSTLSLTADTNTQQESAKEPMTEQDVSYDKLEEMTAKADGKAGSVDSSQPSISTKKIVD